MFTNLDTKEIQLAVREYAERNLERFDHDISGKALSVDSVRVFLDKSTSRDGVGQYAIRVAVETTNDSTTREQPE